MQRYYSNGKLLLTGEYVVLDGALALAIPTRFGQSLTVESFEGTEILWQSLDEDGKVWFEDFFSLEEIATPIKKRDRKDTSPSFQNKDVGQALINPNSYKLLQILRETQNLNPDFLNKKIGYKITTKLDFPRDWGLGSSSTLINNIANWAQVDAFQLLAQTFKGSGYDIAATQNNSPFLFSKKNDIPIVRESVLSWDFTNKLFFVHLNKKQNSREGIEYYFANLNNSSEFINKIDAITLRFVACTSFSEFEALITEHENIISKIIKIKPVKKLLFNDYKGSIKSLGAWGGDFILVTGDEEEMDYFRKMGFETIIPFEEMII